MARFQEGKPLALIVAGFLAAFFLPVGIPRFDNAVFESLALVKWYAREHVVLCLVPAFFIAGAISVFLNSAAVMKHLGAGAPKVRAYGVASVAGSILAVCSCTVLPIFAGIYRMGAGLGPATAFLYAGPAINVLAIILTARVLGLQIGIARAVGAVLFSLVIGLLMHFCFRRQETERVAQQAALPAPPPSRPLWQTGLFFGCLVGILVFANLGGSQQGTSAIKWWLTGAAGVGLGAVLVFGFRMPWPKLFAIALPPALVGSLFPGNPLPPFLAAAAGLAIAAGSQRGELQEWLIASWGFAKQILPLLLLGVLAAGFCLGRPGHEGVIPAGWVARAVGGNGLGANLFAAVAGAFMYFATLTEVPILQGLLGAGMGQGPALALLLAGPALSLPSILVIQSLLGIKKTCVFIGLVVIVATVSGWIFGAMVG